MPTHTHTRACTDTDTHTHTLSLSLSLSLWLMHSHTSREQNVEVTQKPTFHLWPLSPNFVWVGAVLVGVVWPHGTLAPVFPDHNDFSGLLYASIARQNLGLQCWKTWLHGIFLYPPSCVTALILPLPHLYHRCLMLFKWIKLFFVPVSISLIICHILSIIRWLSLEKFRVIANSWCVLLDPPCVSPKLSFYTLIHSY